MIGHPTALVDWLPVAPTLLGLAGGALLLVLRRVLALQPLMGVIVLAGIVLCNGALLCRVLAQGPVSVTMGRWLPPFGISFAADAIGALFALVSSCVALLVAFHLLDDAPEAAVRDGLYPLVLLLMAGVNGAFLTGDLFNLYVWFEVMLIASFGLLVLAGNPLQFDGAVKYGVLNILATALFLAALGLLYGELGTLNMADIVGAAGRADPLPLTAIAALFALAFGMKAAIFPVNAWLPASYHTPPAAISALLGGILTKVGVYALVRLLVMLLPAERALLSPAITTLAIATMLLGPLSALAETHLRRAIGFLLIGGIGVTLLAVTSADITALQGGILYTAVSMPILAALYLVAGVLERLTGHGDSRDISGLYEKHPVLALTTLALILSLVGIPPFLGFWPKLLLLQGFVAAAAWPQVFAILLSSLLMLVAGVRLWSRIFWREAAHAIAIRPPMLALALLATLVLILPARVDLLLTASEAAARTLLDPSSYIAAVGLAP